jgi:hypothetical protein
MKARKKTILTQSIIVLAILISGFGFAQRTVAKDKSALVYYAKAIDFLNKGDEEKAKVVFNKGVMLDMAKTTVDDILEPCYKKGMVKVKYKSYTGKDNFDELVYKIGKPTVVLFYDVKPEKQSPDVAKREAIVFKTLSEMYGNKLNFVVYNDRIAPKKRGLHPNDGYWNISERSIKECIKGLPSIAIYSKFDLEKGETPTKNDGKLKQVDIMNGGPMEDKYIFPTFENTSFWWIQHHCFYQPSSFNGNKQVYKYNNTFKLIEVDGLLVK